MSTNCQKGLTYLFQLEQDYARQVEQALTAKTAGVTIQQAGIVPVVRPYLLRSDGVVACFVFLCFIILSYVLARSKSFLLQAVHSFFVLKIRVGVFDSFTASDARYRLILLFQTCVLFGFCAYDYLSGKNSLVFLLYPHVGLLGMLIAIFILFFLFKCLLFKMVNRLFFDKVSARVWMDSFFNVLVGIGFLLSPIILLIVYFDLSADNAIYSSLFVVLISKIFLFYKCKTTFFNKFHHCLHLILYFCTLEIVPDLLFWKGIVLMNTSLVLNF